MKTTIVAWVFLCSVSVGVAETNLIEVLRRAMAELEARESSGGVPPKDAAPASDAASATPVGDAGKSPSPTVNLALGDGDVVTLVVEGEPDLCLTNAVLDTAGVLTVRFLGPVNLSGKTCDAAKEWIREQLAKDYLVDPRVRLELVRPASATFTVTGAVTRPGPFTWPRREPLSLSRAIGMAGGTLRGADLTRVTVQRMVDGRQQIEVHDASRLSREPDARQPRIHPGDVVEVSRRR